MGLCGRCFRSKLYQCCSLLETECAFQECFLVDGPLIQWFLPIPAHSLLNQQLLHSPLVKDSTCYCCSWFVPKYSRVLIPVVFPWCQLGLGSPECSFGLGLMDASTTWFTGILGDQLGHLPTYLAYFLHVAKKLGSEQECPQSQ